jgi:hypothetical protein
MVRIVFKVEAEVAMLLLGFPSKRFSGESSRS